ncbi:acyl-CoA synthetase [Desulfatitalea tepidiphila]|uniref:acyl-CoA synthetase n=1 Tax=Desulfatitalea tepidiphila TaxID=1185843 RepID=UPI0006B5AC50|nr:acyl-CoA synthetase [Desulfatitalea tepidiphila]
MGETFTIRNLADIEAIEKVPLLERVTEKSTYELISKGAAINPDATAMSFILDGERFQEPIRVTYGQFMAKIRQTANMLADWGVGPTDVVTYLLPNLPQTHFVLWGAETAGIANPINPMLEADTIKEICQAAGTKVLVALGDMPGVDIWPKVEQIRKSIPSLEKVLRVMGPTDEAEGIFSYEETVERYAGDRLTFDRQIAPDDIASLYHTGGTTGRPKLARRSHFNEVALSWGLKAAAELQPGEAVMVGLPLFHCNGTCVTGLLPFSLGGEVVILSPSGYRNPSIMKNFYKIVEYYKPVFFSCVPTVLSVLLDIPVGDADISSLKYLICGAAPLSVELFRRFEAHSGMKILEGYGLTESTCASCVNPKDGERKIGSIGIRLPYQNVKVMILDADGRYLRDAEIDEIGSVCISGPTAFKGYVEEIHNRGLWVKEGWFNTGDMGRMDKDGFFWLTGRMKELIIRGGHNIDPATIEEPLYKMKGVNMVAAVGRPDAHAGEVPVAYVALAQDAGISENDIVQWAQSHIGERAAIPKAVYIVDQIPLTAVGKVFKPALRWDAIRRAYEQELAQLGDLAQSIEVRVSEDKVHGTLATIRIQAAAGADRAAIEAKVGELLARYTVRFGVEFV